MIFVEMSRVEAHGGGTWSFPNCIWSPTRKENGQRWAFWEKILSVKAGDIIIHLRGVQPNASFVGYSEATSDGFITSARPPEAGAWSFAENFYRADLDEYIPFHQPIRLSTIFSSLRSKLENYFDQNRSQPSDHRNIFYVRQSGRLQCLNGAYLSDLDQHLFEILFDPSESAPKESNRDEIISIATGWQLRTIQARTGQAEFSKLIKQIYGQKCCFPSCEIEDPRFLVGAHIARWCDNEALRGNLGNGICLCVFHDRAFELGLFTLDENYKICVNHEKFSSPHSAVLQNLSRQNRQPISLASVLPLDEALLEHWIRIGVTP